VTPAKTVIDVYKSLFPLIPPLIIPSSPPPPPKVNHDQITESSRQPSTSLLLPPVSSKLPLRSFFLTILDSGSSFFDPDLPDKNNNLRALFLVLAFCNPPAPSATSFPSSVFFFPSLMPNPRLCNESPDPPCRFSPCAPIFPPPRSHPSNHNFFFPPCPTSPLPPTFLFENPCFCACRERNSFFFFNSPPFFFHLLSSVFT